MTPDEFRETVAFVYGPTFDFLCRTLLRRESVRRGILVGNILRVSIRLFGVAEFHHYALADGIAILFRRYGA